MLPNNILQQVATYADPSLAYLMNLNCFLTTLNTKYRRFEDLPAQLGATVDIRLPTRATSAIGLVASFQPAVDRFVPLTCDQAINSSMAFSVQQFIFNAEQYMEQYGKARVESLSAAVESNLALNAISGVPVMTVDSNGQSQPTGALHIESGPYRFYNALNGGLTSFQQLAQINYQFRNYGAAHGMLNVYLDDQSPVNITGTGLNQFVMDRNEELANSWDLGTYKGARANYYSSNLLAVQTAGTLGAAQTALTITSVTNTPGTNYSTIVCSGAGSGNTINSGDLAQFLDGVGSFQNLRFLTFTGYIPSAQPVQVRAIANATSSGGNITFNVFPQLISAPGFNQNLNQSIQAGMQLAFIPSHRAGLVVGGDAFFLSMPPLPDEHPYETSTVVDEDTKVSMRLYYGSLFGQNFRGVVNDCLWAALCVPEYSMRICLPV